MLEVELVLSVYVGKVDIQQKILFLHFLVEGCAGYRRVKHELVEVRVVRYRVLDFLLDVIKSVVLEAHDG